MESFIPRGQEGLLLPNPLKQNYISTGYLPKSLLYSRNIRQNLSHMEEAGILEEGSAPKRLGFFTRHNPHPGRVRHIKGLLDAPICMVEDNYQRRLMFSPPTGEDYTIHYRPKGSTRYSANHSKQIPAIGIVPITYAWKDELEKKTQKALNKALGQFPLPPSQQSQRNGEFDHLDDEQILDLLCRILQTGSIPACQAWLQSCTESEKTIVLNMLRMAAMGEIDPYPQQQQPTDTYKSNFHANKPRHSQSRETDAKEPLNEAKDLLEENTPFKLPKHDTIIQSAQSRTAEISRQSQRSFHERLQMELDQSETLTRNRQRSRSLTTPPDKRSRPSSGRCTARPCSAGGVYRTICNDSLYPPPPVRVTVSREKLQGKPLTQQSYRR